MKGLIFTYLLTVAGVFYGIFNPVYGAAIYVTLAILKPAALWFWVVPMNRYSFYVAVCTLVGWTLRGFGTRQHLGAVAKSVLCMVGFVGWYWISAAFSKFSGPGLYYAVEKASNDMLMLLVALTLINNFKQLRVFAFLIVVATSYVAFEFNLSYYGGWNRMFFNEFAGVDNNGMAMTFAIAVPVALGVGLYEKKWLYKGLAWAGIPFLINAIFFGESRTGMMGLLASSPFLVILLPNKKRTFWILGGVIAGALFLAGPSVQNRFSTIFLDDKERDSSANARFVSWEAGYKCMMDHPLLGVGPRCFPLVAKNYGAGNQIACHNMFIQVGADVGIPGVFLLLGMFLYTMKALRRGRKDWVHTSPWYTFYGGVIISALAAAVMSAQFVSMERLEMPYLVIMLGMASVKVAMTEYAQANSEPEIEPLPAGPPRRVVPAS